MNGSTATARKILILTAIPDGLHLDKEIREIEEAIRRSVRREQFETRIRTAVRPQDIRRALAEEQPYITEAYPTLDTNHSPFNVGIPIDLLEFNRQQVETLAKGYEVDEQGLTQLMDLVGGHPYLIQQALANLKSQQVTLE